MSMDVDVDVDVRSIDQPAADLRRSMARGLRRLVALSGAVGALCLVGASPAAAHVSVTAASTAAGAHTVVAVSVPHGCDGSPTTRVSISVPEGIYAVTPTRHPLWKVSKQSVTLDPPVADAHGNEITERVASITYRALTPLPEGYRDVFELALTLPDAEGDNLVFPTVQTCQEGEAAWIEVAEDGGPVDDLALPAPGFTITAAQAAHHTPTREAADSGAAAERASGSSTGASTVRGDAIGDTGPVALGALVLGTLGAVLGGSALVLQRRRG